MNPHTHSSVSFFSPLTLLGSGGDLDVDDDALSRQDTQNIHYPVTSSRLLCSV